MRARLDSSDVLASGRGHRRAPECREEHALQPAHRPTHRDHLRRGRHDPRPGLRHLGVERPHLHRRGHRRPRARAGDEHRGARAGPGARGDRGGRSGPLRRRRACRARAARLRGRRSPAPRRGAGDPRRQQGRQPRSGGRCGRVLRPRLRSLDHDQRPARSQYRRPGRPDRGAPPAAERGRGGGIGPSGGPDRGGAGGARRDRDGGTSGRDRRAAEHRQSPRS